MSEAGYQPWMGGLWQCLDSAFPSGAFSHSLALEGLVQGKVVQTPGDLQTYLLSEFAANQIYFELPYIRLGHEALARRDTDTFAELTAEAEATLATRELREASRSLGRQRRRILQQLYPDDLHWHQLANLEPTFLGMTSLQTLLVSAPLSVALAGHVWQGLAHQCAAALKLIRIGQTEGQLILQSCLKMALPHWVEASLPISRADAGCLLPVLDIASAHHETAFNRLFIS